MLAQLEEPERDADLPEVKPEPALEPIQPEQPEPSVFDWMNPGPLPPDIAKTFSGGRYARVVVGQEGWSSDHGVYRVYGGRSGSEGRDGTFYALLPQTGGLQSQIDLALRPEWGNTAENVTCIYLSPGTVIYVGSAASQGGPWVGGATQVYVPK